MDCPACGEPIGAANVICRCCGKRLARPVEGSGSVGYFTRARWLPLPAEPETEKSKPAWFDVLFEIVMLPVELLLELL